MYTAFVTDVYSWKIVGWALSAFDARRSLCSCRRATRRPCVPRKQRAWFTI
ncbi:hypothetical protein ACL1FZ_04385 [Corynebacterium striatum]|uniref:hypothetical protein n=1 Tax=Corynebacterium striatum TaxID=43770 RepID=UPI003AE045F4